MSINETTAGFSQGERKEIPAGLWCKCQSCGEVIYTRAMQANLNVCPSCGYYAPLTAWERIRQLTDATEKGFVEMDDRLTSLDPLEFAGDSSYVAKLREAQQKTGLPEAVVTGKAWLEGHRFGLAVMDFRFMGASMGAVVGEKITRVTEWATRRELPMVIVTASGGARMQEGALSLMQMAKTAGAVERHDEEGLPLIIILTHPTTGGVTASFASLGDVILSEPHALVGFAGPRVVEQTTRQKLPENFQRAEYLVQHGFIDAIVERKDLRGALASLLRSFQR
ncbi:MAG: acetyl-CoA carboxylase, carboxyltransferase subunit beta [Oligosphaeraceae bacterium]